VGTLKAYARIVCVLLGLGQNGNMLAVSTVRCHLPFFIPLDIEQSSKNSKLNCNLFFCNFVLKLPVTTYDRKRL
jgi:hypothetical protein